MKPKSQYTDRYLKTNAERGEGNGLTPGSFLTYALMGRAKAYADIYQAALIRALDARVEAGEAQRGTSARGRDAYYPTK